MGISRRTLSFTGLSLLGAAVVLAACSDHGDPVLRNDPVTPVQPVAPMAFLLCKGDVQARTVTCQEEAPPLGLGGARAAHYIYIESARHALLPMNDFGATSSTVFFDQRVVNLVPQPIGTDDGVTLHSRGVRVFFWSNPTVTSGTGSIWIIQPSTTMTFTAPNQAYHQYNEIIQSQDTSVAEKRYVFGISGNVAAFEFRLALSTNMQWAAITLASAATASISVNGTVDLDAARVNALGDTMSISSISWASDNTPVATVDASTGVVTGVSAGVANIIASQSGSRSDTVVVTVN